MAQPLNSLNSKINTIIELTEINSQLSQYIRTPEHRYITLNRAIAKLSEVLNSKNIDQVDSDLILRSSKLLTASYNSEEVGLKDERGTDSYDLSRLQITYLKVLEKTLEIIRIQHSAKNQPGEIPALPEELLLLMIEGTGSRKSIAGLRYFSSNPQFQEKVRLRLLANKQKPVKVLGIRKLLEARPELKEKVENLVVYPYYQSDLEKLASILKNLPHLKNLHLVGSYFYRNYQNCKIFNTPANLRELIIENMDLKAINFDANYPEKIIFSNSLPPTEQSYGESKVDISIQGDSRYDWFLTTDFFGNGQFNSLELHLPHYAKPHLLANRIADRLIVGKKVTLIYHEIFGGKKVRKTLVLEGKKSITAAPFVPL